MTFVKPIGWAAAMLIGCGLLAPSAQAGYTVTLTQQGSNVVASGSGTIDLTDLSFFSGDTINSGMVPRDGAITTGPTIGPILGTFVYSGVTGPTSFGSGGPTAANSGSGDGVAIAAAPAGLVGFVLFVPNGYVSDSPLSDTSTYDNQTFVTLGATPGTYVWTWGSGADADSFTLDIGTIAPILPTKTLPTESCPINIIRGFLVLACYEFSDAPSSHLFDPATASGYAYQMTDGSLFTEIDLPTGFVGGFDVTSPGCSIPGTFQPGQSVDFVALCGQGVSSFEITGIDPMFDPTNVEAFPIELAFNTQTADFIAAPIGPVVPAPEPPSVLLFVSGMVALGLIRARQAL